MANSLKSSEFYDKFSNYYHPYSLKKKRYLLTIDNLIIKNMNGKIDSLVDIGCADGIRGHKIYKKLNAINLTLVDNSEKMLSLAKKIPGAKVYSYDISSKKKFPTNHKYDLAMSLWNVFGHINSYSKRTMALKNISKLINKDGTIVIDVSNRYNASYYGNNIASKNIEQDIVYPSIQNGDVLTRANIAQNLSVPYFCHFFNPFELEEIAKKVGLKVSKKYYVNYDNGKIVDNFLEGQILYFFKK